MNTSYLFHGALNLYEQETAFIEMCIPVTDIVLNYLIIIIIAQGKK